MDNKINVLDLDYEELNRIVTGLNEKSFRTTQLYDWFKKGIVTPKRMTNIPGSFFNNLSHKIYFPEFKILKKQVSADKTMKLLIELNDKSKIECVVMNYNYGNTICLSTQVGCRMGCKFCASSLTGLQRNLSPGEMLGQIVAAVNEYKEKITHIVLMGTGEPFDNYKNVVKFIKLVHQEKGFNIGFRKITVSTCGLADKIISLADEGLQVNLSVSLHAPNNEIRKKIMPVGKKFNIEKIINSCKIFTAKTGRRITFEYAIIKGMNNKPGHALELAGKIKDLNCHVNLIRINTVGGKEYKRCSQKEIEDFRQILVKNKIGTTIRRELGQEIDAACGQLRARSLP